MTTKNTDPAEQVREKKPRKARTASRFLLLRIAADGNSAEIAGMGATDKICRKIAAQQRLAGDLATVCIHWRQTCGVLELWGPVGKRGAE